MRDEFLEGPTPVATPTTLDALTPNDTMKHYHRVSMLNMMTWNEIDVDIILRVYRLIDEQKKRDVEDDKS
ncbi:MAG: hypothetical protein BA870_02245 [Desulfuromonadales bacterium C00003094]|jgi:hypothetical protein|nr:MAG: hypothetical protein BA870_02245 [Desulfuromonadales bacterium C00003094]